MKMWVLGAAERAPADTKSMRFWVVKNRKKDTLHPILKRHVDAQSWVFSDAWKAYNGLSAHFFGHRYCNHSV